VAKRSRQRRSSAALLRSVGHLCLWVLVLAAPFVLQVTAKDAFRLPKLLASEWLGLASLLAYSLAAATAKEAPVPARGSAPAPAPAWWRHPAVLATLPVMAVASLGLLTSPHPEHTRQALPDLWIAGACLVGWSLVLEEERLGRFLRALVLPAALMAAFAVLQAHDVYRPFQFAGGEERVRTGITSFAGNAGDLGAYLVLPALAAQWGLVRSLREERRRPLGIALWAGGLLLAVYGLAVSQSLTPAVALLAGTGLYWLAGLPGRRAALTAAAVAVLTAVLVLGVPPLRQRVETVTAQLGRGDLNAALTGRLDGWRAALWMVGERPWTGVGHGGYRAEFAEAKLVLLDRGVEFYPAHVEPFFANAHNDFLEAAAEWGLPGVAALLWGLAVLGRSLAAGGCAAPGSAERWDRAFAWGATGAVAVLALGQFPFHVALVAYPCLLLLAWVFRRGALREGAA
jgi:hypothetical protein